MHWVKNQSIGFIIRTKFCVSRYYCQSYRIIFPEHKPSIRPVYPNMSRKTSPGKQERWLKKLLSILSYGPFNHSPILNFQPPLIFLKGNCFVPFLSHLQTHCSANHQRLITNTTSVFPFLTSTKNNTTLPFSFSLNLHPATNLFSSTYQLGST